MPNHNINRRVVLSSAASDSLSELGIIFENDGTSITGFTNTSGNFSSDGVKITAAKSGGTTFSSRLAYNVSSYTSNLETWSQNVTFDVASKSGFGLALGTDGTNPMCGLLFLTTVPGKIRIFNSTSGTVLAESVGSITINNNDIIYGVHTIAMNTHTFEYHNLNNSQSVSVSYTFPLSYPIAQTQPTNYKPALYAVGGTQYVTNWMAESSVLIGSSLGFIGDSITARFFATSETTRWAYLTGGANSVIFAAPGNRTADFVTPSQLGQITLLFFTKVVICLGTNDVLNGVPVATSMANLTTLKNTIESYGGEVIFCQIPPLDSTSVVTYNSTLVSTFGALVKPDFYTLLKGGGTAYAVGKSPDGIHPADTEQQDMADEVSQYL